MAKTKKVLRGKGGKNKTLKVSVRDGHLRGLDFYSPERHNPRVTIVGAGGIGSQVALALTKLGVHNLTVIDMDRVEPHNVATTPYSQKDLGVPKVVALQKIVEGATPSYVTYRGINKRFTPKTRFPRTDVLISAVDNGPLRSALLKAAYDQRIPCFIDGRIGGERLRVYTVNMKLDTEVNAYLDTIPKPGMESPLPCTGEQVSDVGLMVAGYITRAFRRWVVEGVYEPEVLCYHAEMQLLSSAPRRVDTGELLPLSVTETVEVDEIATSGTPEVTDGDLLACPECVDAETLTLDEKRAWHRAHHPRPADEPSTESEVA